MADGFDAAGQVAVVTGGGSGIGQALCRSLAQSGISSVVLADLDIDAARRELTERGVVVSEVFHFEDGVQDPGGPEQARLTAKAQVRGDQTAPSPAPAAREV